MPIYESLCTACHRKSSLFVKSSTSSLTPKCPFCGSEEMINAAREGELPQPIKELH